MSDPRWYSLRTSPLVVGSNLTRVILPTVLEPWQVQSAAVPTNTATSGTTEKTLATLSIPAKPWPYTLVVAAFFSGVNSVDVDEFQGRIKIGGTQKALVQVGTVGAGTRRTLFALPTCTPTTIAVNTAASVTVTIQRSGGTGTFTQDVAGVVTATIMPNAT